MAWLIVHGPEETAHEIDEDVTFLGSADDAQVRLSAGDAAPKHCQVIRRRGKVRVICKADPKHKQVQG